MGPKKYGLPPPLGAVAHYGPFMDIVHERQQSKAPQTLSSASATGSCQRGGVLPPPVIVPDVVTSREIPVAGIRSADFSPHVRVRVAGGGVRAAQATSSEHGQRVPAVLQRERHGLPQSLRLEDSQDHLDDLAGVVNAA